MTTYDIAPGANSLGMVLYNLWIHIAQAMSVKHVYINRTFLYPRPVSRLTTSAFARISLILNFEKIGKDLVHSYSKLN
ncbi:hypothetical protein BpHYR1_020992 [Brachionus plicatilis]|uniref:Uncharacterized protein n=1 Tax=Brachionus plicatilis TaxID=10195 RepID=A0A3M7T1L7_BRAPC|nr:hypothetical protein BpHYR1_020992 [Brachionus plicatilis]